VFCTASDDCHDAGVCDPTTGSCSNPAAPDKTACNDGNACTQSDSCQAGSCVGANPVSCAAADQCHVAGVCDPTTGTCSNPAAADNTTCNDGDACTLTDTCQAGVCTGSGSSPACNSADLSLKLQAPKQVKLNRTLDYRLSVKNGGPDTATSAAVSLSCSGIAFQLASSSGCAVSGTTITCPLGSLTAGQSANAAISLVAEASGTLTCSATASSLTPDPNTGNQSRTETTQVR
jgi:hypothetical protein